MSHPYRNSRALQGIQATLRMDHLLQQAEESMVQCFFLFMRNRLSRWWSELQWDIQLSVNIMLHLITCYPNLDEHCKWYGPSMRGRAPGFCQCSTFAEQSIARIPSLWHINPPQSPKSISHRYHCSCWSMHMVRTLLEHQENIGYWSVKMMTHTFAMGCT